MNALAGQLLQRSEIAAALAPYRSAGQAIVFTNGCFDLLHIGHVRYLAEARSHGNVLVVGLNSDASVRGLKGPRRPLVPQAERAEMLAHLASVDYVTIFDEPTADALIEVVRPAIYVNGGDIVSSRVPELATVERHGVRLVIASLVEERSTTEIIARVLAAYDSRAS